MVTENRIVKKFGKKYVEVRYKGEKWHGWLSIEQNKKAKLCVYSRTECVQKKYKYIKNWEEVKTIG